jgi:hypothetical protein
MAGEWDTRPTGSIHLWLALISLRQPATSSRATRSRTWSRLTRTEGRRSRPPGSGSMVMRSSSPHCRTSGSSRTSVAIPRRAVDSVNHHERVGIARISCPVWHRARDRGWCLRGPPAPRPYLSRARRRLPGDAQSPAGVRHQDHCRAPRRCRAVEPTPPLNVTNRAVRGRLILDHDRAAAAQCDGPQLTATNQRPHELSR